MKKIFWFTFGWIVLGFGLEGLYTTLMDGFLQQKIEVYLTQLNGGDFATQLQELLLQNTFSLVATTYYVLGIGILAYLVINTFEKKEKVS